MSANNALKLGRISVKNTAILICDIQEKFRNGIGYFPQIVTNTRRILDASKVMEIPIAFTEQYPKGLGATVPELAIETYSSKRFEKTQFSMCTPEMKSFLDIPDLKSIILCGIEAHACIRQTAMDLIEAGYDVHVVVDCCSSRNQVDRKYAFKHLQNIGAFLTTTESVILSFAPNAAHPKFKELQKIIRDFSADTGLVSPSPKAAL